MFWLAPSLVSLVQYHLRNIVKNKYDLDVTGIRYHRLRTTVMLIIQQIQLYTTVNKEKMLFHLDFWNKQGFLYSKSLQPNLQNVPRCVQLPLHGICSFSDEPYFLSWRRKIFPRLIRSPDQWVDIWRPLGVLWTVFSTQCQGLIWWIAPPAPEKAKNAGGATLWTNQ